LVVVPVIATGRPLWLSAGKLTPASRPGTGKASQRLQTGGWPARRHGRVLTRLLERGWGCRGKLVTFEPIPRPVRAAFVGLGRIYDLNVHAYVGNADAEVVALVDPSDERRRQRQADWPEARTFASMSELAASGVEVDAVEVLLPIPLHPDAVVEMLGHGWHVNLQKPICNDMASARRMVGAAAANSRVLRVMENYVF
jgi:Oxidoreductase family, NAD-binding Rossmann fold